MVEVCVLDKEGMLCQKKYATDSVGENFVRNLRKSQQVESFSFSTYSDFLSPDSSFSVPCLNKNSAAQMDDEQLNKIVSSVEADFPWTGKLEDVTSAFGDRENTK